MRIMHTADWHLGARIGPLRRIDDQLAQVERVLALCDEHKADVLFVAGDVFEVEETDDLEAIMKPLSEMLQRRVANGLIGVYDGKRDRGATTGRARVSSASGWGFPQSRHRQVLPRTRGSVACDAVPRQRDEGSLRHRGGAARPLNPALSPSAICQVCGPEFAKCLKRLARDVGGDALPLNWPAVRWRGAGCRL